MGDKVESIVTLRIRYIRIGVVGDQQLDDIEVSVACSPLHRCSDEITAERINLCALLQQVSTCGSLSIDRCPVKRGAMGS